MLSTATASQRERAAIGAFSLLPKAVVKEIRDTTRDAVVPLFQREALRLSDNKVLDRIIGSARYAPYHGVPGVRFGGTRRVTSSGVQGKVLVRPLEFGSDGRRYEDYLQRRGDKEVSVLRRTTRQFMPDTGYRGHAINRAAEAISEDVVQLWVDLVETAVINAFEGKATRG